MAGKADASADRVLAKLPEARFAHLATHGFFADPQFRSVLQADPQQFREMALRGFGAGDKNLDAVKIVNATPVQPGGRNPAVLWAAFSLSGAGR
jgi:hypothetical protein